MQKQRMEFENLLAQRLREQEHALRTQLDNALLEKDANIQSLLNVALQTQKQITLCITWCGPGDPSAAVEPSPSNAPDESKSLPSSSPCQRLVLN